MPTIQNVDDWGYWESFFAQRLPFVAATGKPPYDRSVMDKGFVPFLEFLFEKEAKHRMESEQYCRRLARSETSDTPQSDWAGYITYLRWLGAADFLSQMESGGASGMTGMKPPKGVPVE